MIPPVPQIAALSPYALAQLTPPNQKPLVSLAQNESLRPPSPKAVKAAANACHSGHLYPDPDWVELRMSLAKLYNFSPDSILCGCGSMQLIGCIAQTYAAPDRAVLCPEHSYPFFRTATQLAGARFDVAAESEGKVSVDALLEAVRPDTRVVFVANPGNPTGTRISRSELLRLRDGLPDNILLVIDEAYGEFADHLNESLFDLTARGNTVVLRSFSKAYGLAAFRVGWGVFPKPIANELRKVMNPNNVSAASQAAASAALADQSYMRETCALTSSIGREFRQRLLKAQFDVAESFTNFLLINFHSRDRAQSADAALRQEGVFLRPQGGVGLGHCLRATIAEQQFLELTGEILENWAKEQR